MEQTDVARLEERLRGVYERARLRRALIGFAPILLVVLLCLLLSHRSELVLGAGALLFGVGVFALWYGREPGRAVFPAALGGSVAALMALCASRMTFLCTGEACMSWCVPACTASGVVAGVLVSFVGLRQRRRAGYWITAVSITLLAGALGCSCMGNAGLLALATGLGTVLLGSLVSTLAWRRPRQNDQ